MRIAAVRRVWIALASVACFAATSWVVDVAAQTPAGGAASLPRTRPEAEKWLRDRKHGAGPDALGFYLGLSSGLSADVVRVMLVSGASATKPTATGDYPLSALAISCDGQAAAAEIGEVLLQAGADVNAAEPTGRKATPAMAAVMCPGLMKAILARKPNLNVVEANGLTAMDYAIRWGKPREEVMKMLVDAGFDLARHRVALLENYSDTVDKIIESLPGGKTAAPAAPPRAARGATPSTSSTPRPSARIVVPDSPVPVAVDWTAVGPYPSRSANEATRMLARPGTDLTPDDHFWDGITRRQPQRLALALQAGASARQTRTGTGYTPLMVLAEGCDLNRDVELQVSIAEQLLAAGADAKVIHPEGWTALMNGAGNCPIAVVKMLVAAGSPLSAAKDGNTALKLAIFKGRADVVDVLLDAGLDLKKEPYNVGRIASSGGKEVEAALKKKRR